MRVLYFSRDYTPHDYRFLTSLAGAGLDVHFLRLERGKRQLEDRPLPHAVKQINWAGGQGLFHWGSAPARLLELRRILREVKPDLVHAGPIQASAFLTALVGFQPLVSMSWGSDLLRDADKNFSYRFITRFTLRRSTVLVGDCRAVHDKAVSLGFSSQKIFTFPWGIDLDHFSPATGNDGDSQTLRQRLGWQDKFTVLSLRSWEPVYGIDVLLRGFARAALEAPELRLMMMGGGSQAGLVHQIIQDYNLGDRVYLGGQVSQNALPQIYRAADLYVSASHSDGSSVSLMEALGCGLPVLVSDIPSNREWVVSGDQGWLFGDGDESGLARMLLRALREPERRRQMGRSARLLAENRADWKKNFQVLLRSYEKAMQ